MGVISMQMMRQYQYSGVGHSKPKPSSSSMQLSKKRRFAVYPPKQYPAADKHLSRRNRRCSSPQSHQSFEGRPPRPPRHPDSPVSLSSSLPSLSDALHIPNDIVYTKSLDSIIDEYKNEKFPAEILARLQRKTVNDINNCDSSTNDKDEQRDEANEEYTTSSSNDTLGFSVTSQEEEPMGEKKESIFEFITKRLVGSLVKKKGK